MGAREYVAVLIACTSALAWQPAAAVPATHCSLRSRCITLNDRLTPEQQKAQKEKIQAMLDAADNKLDSLNKVEKLAPTSFADLGTPLAAEPDPMADVPGWLSVAPQIIGGFSVTLFLLNQFGVFGSGPSMEEIDALVEEWSKP